MGGLESLFSGTNFKNTLQGYCRQIGWKIAELDQSRAVLKFTMPSGRPQTLYIIRFDTTIEFSVPSLAQFEDENNIPHELSTLLLKSNAENKIGFWCIEKIGSKHTYSIMHNAELQLINVQYFERVVSYLIKECDRFEGILLKILRG